MKDFEKTYTVQGSSEEHTIKVTAHDDKLTIRCDCEAGIHKRLCKHIIQLATSDEELQPFLVEAALDKAFDNIFYAKKEIERLQAESRRLRIKIEKAIF